MDVQVYERATELRELGQAIALSPNGLRSLEKIGVDSVLEDGFGYLSANLEVNSTDIRYPGSRLTVA